MSADQIVLAIAIASLVLSIIGLTLTLWIRSKL